MKIKHKKDKLNLTDDERKKCQTIIHSASVATGGVGTGLAQIPLADNVLITPIQVAMITSLGKVFNVKVTESVAKGIIGSAVASMVGRTASQLLVGWIPGIGNAINTATAAGLTETIGWIAVYQFNNEAIRFKEQGYKEASKEYEEKLRKQAEDFVYHKKDAEKNKEEYEELIKQFKEYIKKKEHENDSLKSDIWLDRMKRQYNSLLALQMKSEEEDA